SGKMPYHTAANARQVISRVLEGPPEPVSQLAPDIPRELVAIIEKAMARAPEDRYPSARELAEDLKRFTTGQLVSVHQYTMAMLVRRWARRHRAVLGMAGLMVAVLLAVAGLGVRRIAQER